jgi:ribosomal protein L11 methylase PrmA
MERFWRVRVEAPAELEDELLGRLFAAGSEGSWSEAAGNGRLSIHGFFAGPEADLEPRVRALAFDPAISVSTPEAVAETDWLATWRVQAGPIRVGEHFLVDPREPEEASEPFETDGRWLIRLPARTAFGTGSHESTRLAVELLEQQEVAGQSVLDVGTGSGILAFAAVRLGARRVVALDVDPAAALLLPQTMQLNELRFTAFTGGVHALRAPGRGARRRSGGTEASSEGEGARTAVEPGRLARRGDRPTGLSHHWKSLAEDGAALGGTDPGGIDAGRGEADVTAGFDLALVNVVPEEIAGDLALLARLLRPGGRALFSGILDSAGESAESRLAEHGFRVIERRSAGEWVAFAAEVAEVDR